MDFEDEIKECLKSLEWKQQCKFAWLCGVRALPLLSTKRKFAYWPEKDRQKHLCSIFYVLDATRADADTPVTTIAASAVAAAKAYANAYADDAAYAVRAAVYAARAYATNIYDAKDYAARAAAYVTRAYADDTYTKAIRKYDYNKILFEDIEAIKENRLDKCNHDVGIYGELWNEFQEDLKAIGCSYWAKLYEGLFKNGFDMLDEKEFERRFSVPDEIKEEGAAAVGRYLDVLGDNVERLNEARIIILGEKGAGKTSIARRLLDINKKMPGENESTEGVETSIWRIASKDGTDINAHIWDFAGHYITHSAHRCFMSARCLYIYVYNGRIERDNDPTYWLEQIRIHGGDSPILFLINEKDGHKADVAERTLKKDYPSIKDYYHVDIGSDNKTKLEEFRQTVMDAVRNNPSWNNQVVSEETYKIKDNLRKYFDNTKDPHITRDDFDKIAESCGAPKERIKGILKDLHMLGVCLWYNKDDMEDFNMLVLNPDWITNGIYRIINKGFNEDNYVLSVDKGTEILKNDEKYKYPRDKVAYLFKLMRLYDLAFFKDTNNIFIPGILKLDRPDNDALPTFDDIKDRLTMEFKVEKVLPPNIAARIIVQRHEDIFDENLLWRKGAVLKYKEGDAIAFIEEDGRNVTVKVKGVGKTDYLSSLRETIKKIFEDYKVVKPDLLYEVLESEKNENNKSINSLEKEKPLMLSEETIKGYLQEKLPFFDGPNRRKISLGKTGHDYGIHIGQIIVTGRGDIVTDGGNIIHSTTFNFHNCTIDTQGELSSLARSLENEQKNDKDAKELELAAKELKQIRELIPKDNTEISNEIKENIEERGLFKRFKRIYNDLTDENSELHKKVAKIQYGVETAQKIAKQYNDIAQWVGLPQVPRPLLGKQN